MIAGKQAQRPDEVSVAEAKAELERLLSDARFHGTERTRSLLSYLAERRFDGDGDSVKAYTLALDILGRASDFDSTLDPIVRIEMSRLRASLAQYYEAFGSDCNVSISIPKGRYVAVFDRMDGAGPAFEDETPQLASIPELIPLLHNEKGGYKPAWLPATFAILAGVALVGAVSWYVTRPDFTDKPVVAITMSAADNRLAGEASLTRDLLLTALTQFQTLTIAGQPLQGPSLVRSLRPPSTNAYQIDLKYYGDGGERSVWWQIVDTKSGDLARSGLERVMTEGKTAVSVREELVSDMSRRFAATRALINNIETRSSADGALGNACVLRAEYELDDGGEDDLAAVAACLEKTIAIQPSNPDANATLSRVIAATTEGRTNPEAMARSLALANRAVSLAPMSDRAHIALMTAQFNSGRIEAAIRSGNRALALNANNPDVAAKAAMVLFSSGFWDAGVSLAQEAGRSVDAVPRDATLVLALDAYRRSEWSEASLLAEQINCSDFVVRALRAASLAQLGSGQTERRLSEVRKQNPDFETTFSNDMALRRLPPILTGSIAEGLNKAGAHIEASNSVAGF
ncbi:hypothetical protein OIU34_25475 [Pararhizobium sp. BT-229]|uniref:hypothetical protein n=1 Tax=Pararhizobium sp. BT-229 TaxID=2986923 RepID=UPI0021F77993|nr:hypothetical protein [Pararhizobium sp. BT-229]MCV9965233.1 hypothetical protein [Pararhizobium sp. BT-229]